MTIYFVFLDVVNRRVHTLWRRSRPESELFMEWPHRLPKGFSLDLHEQTSRNGAPAKPGYKEGSLNQPSYRCRQCLSSWPEIRSQNQTRRAPETDKNPHEGAIKGRNLTLRRQLKAKTPGAWKPRRAESPMGPCKG
jgi:hypothetical protein